jgi:hypothetical protein
MFKQFITDVLTKLFPFRTSNRHLSLRHTWQEMKVIELNREFCDNGLNGKGGLSWPIK